MDNNFTVYSKEVVNEFIQSVVIVDDRAYSEKAGVQDFDSSKVLSVFAGVGKLCSIFTPTLIKDTNVFLSVLNNADAIILDWDMRTIPVEPLSLEQEKKLKNGKDSDEEDVETEDPRGEYACNLIKDIVQSTNGLKVIIIYTGDSRLLDICETVKGCANELMFDEHRLTVFNDRIVVAVRAKSNDSTDQFKHIPELRKFIVTYDELPQCVINAYTVLTDGLMPNFALKSLSVIRNQIPTILSVFSRKLDGGYLMHKASMEFPEDARDLLIHIFGDALADLLKNQLPDTQDWSTAWVEDNITDITQNINGVDIPRTKDLIKKLLKSNSSPIDAFTTRLAQKLIESQPNLSGTQQNKLKSSDADLSKLFDINTQDIKISNWRFAILTHHKNVFLPINSEPILSLGTIVRDNTGQYLVCIQQRCDSVRIVNERRFLFLPLVPKGKNPILISDGLKLCPEKDSFSLKTMKFQPKQGESVVKANKDDTGYYFTSVHDERLEWIVELKDLHAQRISHLFTTQLSRVGLDESEWLRTLK